MAKQLSASIGQASLVGGKATNEDFYGVLIPGEPLLTTKGIAAAIADGMSGSEAGKEASELSVTGFLDDYFSTPESWTVKTSVGNVLTALNHWLHGQSQKNYDSHRGLVTTFSGVVIKSTTAHLFHVGDSRIYRWRAGTLECLTQDHRVWLSQDRECLSRALGIDVYVDIDYRVLPVEAGDTFIFTTDGVHDHISDDTLANHFKGQTRPLDQTASVIVQEALANGSDDNLTCQILRVDSVPEQSEDEFYNTLTQLPFPPELSPGMILDGYKILRELHATKHIQVYLALDTDSGQRVVVKTPSINYQDDPHYIDMFVHEEWVGRRLHNPHVMKVCGVTRRRQFLYYVAEYIEGRTLRQWMNDQALPSLRDVRAIVNQIAAGLRAFHRLEMVHRDIKPENIMVDDHGTVKIIDFGSTKIAGLEEIASPLDRQRVVGTREYAAAEYLSGRAGSHRADIFSLGVITYEMLTGRLPYGKALSERSLPRLHYQSARLYNPALPSWLDIVLKKAVHSNPAYRYQSLSKFTFDLSHPHPERLLERPLPLLERNPLVVWQSISVLLLIVTLILLYCVSIYQ
jgi:serine/threonine protein phosphatase PrpC